MRHITYTYLIFPDILKGWKKVNSYFIAIYLMIPFLLFSQGLEYEEYINKAKEALERKDYENAIKNSQSAIDFATKNNIEYYKALEIIADAHKGNNSYPSALDFYLQVLKKIENKPEKAEFIGKINLKIGALYKAWGVHEKAIEYFSKSYESINKKDLAGKSKVATNIASSYVYLENYGSAIRYYKIVVEHLNALDAKDQLSKILKKISDIYIETKNYKEALKYTFNILSIQKNLDNQEEEIITYNNLGFLYKNLNHYDSALFYFLNAESLENTLNRKPNASLTRNIGVMYQNLEKYEESLDYYNKAMVLHTEYGDSIQLANDFNYIATANFLLSRLKKAISSAEKAIDLSTKSSIKEYLATSYKILGSIHQASNDFKKSLKYYQLYIETKEKQFQASLVDQKEYFEKHYIAEKQEKELRLLQVNQQLTDLALKKLALESEKKAQALNLLKREKELQKAKIKQEKLERERAFQQLTLARQALESEKKKKEINLLQKNDSIQRLALKQERILLKQKELEEKERKNDIALLQKAKELQQLKLNEEKKTKIYYLIAIGAMLVVIGLVLVGLVQRHKAHKKLQKQHDEINTQKEKIYAQSLKLEEKNSRITKSISYAKTIQDAILPSRTLLEDLFRNYFIIYRPKDIVSGDFYWCSKVEEKIMLAVLDCTGHGVPGAFMSMIGNTMLNEIVNQNRITDPAKILGMLHSSIQKGLKQIEGSNNDGMDMGLCCIERVNGHIEITYAGAKNTLYYSNGDGEILKISGDRKSVGGKSVFGGHTFNNKKVYLNKGAILYLTTDGFIDQACPERKRFSSKKFRSMLQEHSLINLNTQKSAFEKELIDHKKNAEQRDDITLVAVQVN